MAIWGVLVYVQSIPDNPLARVALEEIWALWDDAWTVLLEVDVEAIRLGIAMLLESAIQASPDGFKGLLPSFLQSSVKVRLCSPDIVATNSPVHLCKIVSMLVLLTPRLNCQYQLL
jgi:hypothetical protein